MTSSKTRRGFLEDLSYVGGALLLPGSLNLRQEFPSREIPGTGERLPMVGFGSTKAVLQIPDGGVEPVRNVLSMFLSAGGRVVDTSPRPAEIDREFGRVLQTTSASDSIFLAVKINTTDADEGVQQFRQSQRLFGRDAFDLVQIESLRGLDAHWPNVLRWKDRGEARYVGVTVSNYYGYEQLESFMQSAALDFIHVNYSVMETRAEERILPLAMDLGLGVLINRPFMNGDYFARVNDKPLPDWTTEFDCTSWAQFSVKYILAHPAVTVTLTETTSPDHMRENLSNAFGRFPDERAKQRMRQLVENF